MRYPNTCARTSNTAARTHIARQHELPVDLREALRFGVEPERSVDDLDTFGSEESLHTLASRRQRLGANEHGSATSDLVDRALDDERPVGDHSHAIDDLLHFAQ